MEIVIKETGAVVSIPLEQGRVFRRVTMNAIETLEQVSIPLEQGRVFRHCPKCSISICRKCLNPFGTGQSLSTKQ